MRCPWELQVARIRPSVACTAHRHCMQNVVATINGVFSLSFFSLLSPPVTLLPGVVLLYDTRYTTNRLCIKCLVVCQVCGSTKLDVIICHTIEVFYRKFGSCQLTPFIKTQWTVSFEIYSTMEVFHLLTLYMKGGSDQRKAVKNNSGPSKIILGGIILFGVKIVLSYWQVITL